MSNPIEQLLLAGATGPRFPANSRYHAVPALSWTGPDGRVHRYLRRRFIPQPDAIVATATARVLEGQRLDRLAAERIGDPERFWRIADANGAMRPADLMVPGRILRIPNATPGAGGG